MKLLITGADGFIGRHAVTAARARGWDVTEFDFDGDVRAAWPWKEDFSHILHLAAFSSNSAFNDHMEDNYETNVGGTHRALGLALAKGARLLYASSSAVYQVEGPDASSQYGSTDSEDDLIDGVRHLQSHYGRSKLINEMMAESYATRGVSCLGLRIFNAYGSGDERKPEGRQAPPTWMTAAKREGRPMIIYGDGTQAKDFIHVSDVVEIIMRLLESDATGVVNVGAGVATSFNDLAKLIGCEVEYAPVPDPASYQYFTRADTTRLLSLIGPYKFKSIEEGLSL